MSDISAISANPITAFSRDDLERFCRILSSLMTDNVGPGIDADLPGAFLEIITNLKTLPICDRLESLGNQLTALPGIDVDAVLDRVFAIDPRDPDGEPPTTEPVPVSSPPATPITFHDSVPIIDVKRETETSGFQTLSLAAVLAEKQDEIDWCVEGLIPSQGVAILGGPPGLGKSWMLLELALAHITGEPWLGRFHTKRGRVLYVDEESPPGLVPFRLQKLVNARTHNIPSDNLQFALGQGLCLTESASLERFRQTLSVTQPSLVIIDSLIRVHHYQENSASEMAQLFGVIKELMREFDLTVVIADHQKKPGVGTVSQDLLLRGTTEKVAFVDTLLSLTKKDGALTIEHSKSRFALPVESFVTSIDDLGPNQTAVRIVGDAKEIRHQAQEEQALELLNRLLADGSWKTRKELTEAAKKKRIKVRIVDDLLKKLHGEGVLERDNRKLTPGRGNKAALYRKKQKLNYVSDFTSIIGTETGNVNETESSEPNGTLRLESGGGSQ